MKKAKFFKSILAASLAGIMCFSVVACGETGQTNPPDDNPPDVPVTPSVGISIGAAPLEIRQGEQVTLTVTITNTTNKKHTWSVTSNGEPSDILAVSEADVVTVAKAVTLDTVVTVTATADEDTTKKASHTFTVRPNLSGQVGDLTAEMFGAVSGPNLTVKGTVTDYYEDLQYSSNNRTTVYDSTVMMDEDAWYGEFSARGEGDLIVSNYRAGAQYGEQGHALMSVFINKDNEVEERAETNYMSVPLIWENQHLYNHLSSLGVDISKKFTYDTSNDEYIYNIVPSGPYDTDFSSDEYLMIYLAVSLTPMLDENFMQFRLKVTDGAITGIWAQTAVATTTAGDGETVLERAYTEVELTISDVGSTNVPEPAPYEAPVNVEYLQEVIDTMKAAKNYTFIATDTSVSAPSYDEGDYEMESVSGGIATVANIMPVAADQYYFKHASSKSTISGNKTGTIGRVTEDAAVFERIGKYSASMDGQDFNFNYSGYKQYDGYFEVLDDEQVYTSVKGLIGVERRQGNYFEEAMPRFDFSPNIFEYGGSHTKVSGSTRTEVHDFILRNTSITNDVARQISAADNADDGEAMAFSTLTISLTVDDAGHAHIYSTEFPYSYGGGNYTGFITTTFSNFGSTTLLADAFNVEAGNYIPRVWRDTWDKYTAHDYNPDHTSGAGRDVSADVALQHMFPELKDLSKLPAPSIFMENISDDVNGPWFDYTVLSDGTVREEFSSNCAMNDSDPRLDRNGRPIDIEGILGPDGTLSKAITALDGWTYSAVNSGRRTPGNPESSYFATYVNADLKIMLVIENNNTKNFFFDFYVMGAWTLSRD